MHNKKKIGLHSKKNQSLADILLHRGLISHDQLNIALNYQKKSEDQSMIGHFFVKLGFITERALADVLSEISGIENYNLNLSILDPQLIKRLPKTIALSCNALPISIKNNELYIAMHDIYNIDYIEQINQHFPEYKVVPVYAPQDDIINSINKYYECNTSMIDILQEIENTLDDGRNLDDPESYKNPIVRLVFAILIDAINKEVSDIHLEPEKMFVRVRYRLDGCLQQVCSFSQDYWINMLSRIKMIAEMNAVETQIFQESRVTLNINGSNIDFRISIQPIIHGENVVISILDKKTPLTSLDSLGFSSPNRLLLNKLLKIPSGIVIITGPPGSGKTSTLYSIINEINCSQINVMSIEDPVEHHFPMIRQSNLRDIKNLSYIANIETMVKQNPDIIIIGEINNKQSAESAFHAAISGLKVFTTLNASDPLSALTRLKEMGIPSSILSGSIAFVSTQRLMRKLCQDCKKSYYPSAEELRILGIDFGLPIYKKNGCDKCKGTGYKGQIIIFEIEQPIYNINKLGDNNENSLSEIMINKGSVTLLHDARLKVLEGISDIEELANKVNITDFL